jgi:hypothetical protein
MGYQMKQPNGCEHEIYELMVKCWQYNPHDRISFQEILEFFIKNYDISDAFKSVSYYLNKIKSQ